MYYIYVHINKGITVIKSDNIPKTKSSQFHLIFMTVIWSYDETMSYRKHALTYHQPCLYDSLMILWWGYVLQEACPYIPLPHILGSLMMLWWDYDLQEAWPYIPPTTSLCQSNDPMMRLCFTGSMPLHTTTSSLWQSYDPMMRLCLTGSMPLHTTTHISMAAIWSHDEAMLYRKHALTYHQPHLYVSLMILWWDYDLQEAWPYIPPTTSLCQSNDPMMRLCFTGNMPLHTTNHVFMTVLWTYDETVFYRKHALTYHQPHLYDSLMIQWWDYVLQEACPYIPQTTSLWQSHDPMMRLCFTGNMPLHTTGHISMAALWSYWWGYALQEAYPYIPQATSLWQPYYPMMRLCFTGSMPLHTTNLISMTVLWSNDETMFYRKHALTYHQSRLYDSLMIQWWGYVLQEACPYIPQTTSLWQSHDPMMRLCFTGNMPLHTTGHISMAALWSYWWGYALQEAFPYIPQATSLWQSYDPMMRLCLTGSIPLHTTNHISMAV